MRKNAFSLIELVIAITVAGIVFSSAMAGYVALVRTEQKAQELRRVQSEARMALLRIGDLLREQGTAYDHHSGGGETTELYLKNGQRLRFSSEGAADFPQNLLYDDAPFFSQNTAVSEGSFFIEPEGDPFSTENLTQKSLQVQPRVRIFMTLVSRNDPSVRFPIRTLFSLRRY